MGEKEKILARFNIKDYREDLEYVLENKKFDEEAKSLLLNIYYKLDNFYKDYLSVKIECEDKNKYLEDYIKIIKAKCNKITMIQPKEITEGDKFAIDIKKGEIKSFPNELVLLQAIYKIIERDVSTDRLLLEDFTKICLNNVMYKAKTINSVEPLRDFTGWSWQISLTDNDTIVNNLIYQNLILLLGYRFVNDNIYKTNIITLLNNELNKQEYSEVGYNFLMDLLELCIIVFNNISKENHEKCLKYKNSLISKRKMLNTRREYVEDKTKSSSTISKQIKKIDDMLENIVLIREQYEKEIKKDKNQYLGISDFIDKKEVEKKKLLNQIKENNKVLNQKQYLFNHDDYENTLKLYDQITEEKEKVNIQNNLTKLQKDFLECMKIKIEKANTKKDLCDIVVELRYYSNLLIKKDKTVIDQNKISKDFENITKQLIYKMVENKFFDIGFVDKEFNYSILKYVFNTKIIELNGIIIKLCYLPDNKVNVEYYDGKMLEYKQTFDIPKDEVVTNKKDKKIKLFKIGG